MRCRSGRLARRRNWEWPSPHRAGRLRKAAQAIDWQSRVACKFRLTGPDDRLDTGCIARGAETSALKWSVSTRRSQDARHALRASAKILDFSPLELFVYDCSAVPGQDNGRVRDRGRLMQHVEELPLGNLLDIVQAFLVTHTTGKKDGPS